MFLLGFLYFIELFSVEGVFFIMDHLEDYLVDVIGVVGVVAPWDGLL